MKECQQETHFVSETVPFHQESSSFLGRPTLQTSMYFSSAKVRTHGSAPGCRKVCTQQGRLLPQTTLGSSQARGRVRIAEGTWRMCYILHLFPLENFLRQSYFCCLLKRKALDRISLFFQTDTLHPNTTYLGSQSFMFPSSVKSD